MEKISFSIWINPFRPEKFLAIFCGKELIGKFIYDDIYTLFSFKYKDNYYGLTFCYDDKNEKIIPEIRAINGMLNDVTIHILGY